MNKLMIAAMVSLALAGCGGGGSDKNTAAEPPAPQMPSGNGGGSGGGGGSGNDDDATPAGPVALAMNCSEQPTVPVNPGSDAKATFSVNKPINTKGILSTSCPGGNTNFLNKSIDVISGQALVKQSVPEGCTGTTLSMTLKLNDENLSATCSFPVAKLQILQFGG